MKYDIIKYFPATHSSIRAFRNMNLEGAHALLKTIRANKLVDGYTVGPVFTEKFVAMKDEQTIIYIIKPSKRPLI